MHVKCLTGIIGAALLIAGCSSSNKLSPAGQSVRFVEDEPGAKCQLIGTATGRQSNWLSGQHGEEGGSVRGTANNLRNRAAAMGGSVIYGVSSPSQGILPSFVPTTSEMIGQVYECPNWELLLIPDGDAKASYPACGTSDHRPDERSAIRHSESYTQTEHVNDAVHAGIDPDWVFMSYHPSAFWQTPDTVHRQAFSAAGWSWEGGE